MNRTAILLAAGTGRRMSGKVADKILVPIHGRPAILYSLQAFEKSAVIHEYIIVYRDEAQKTEIESVVGQTGFRHLAIRWVAGGTERWISVKQALKAIDSPCDYVFIHDCARPCVHGESIQKLALAVERDRSACLAHPVTDTIRRATVPEETRNQTLEHLDRNGLWAMETPQAFAFKDIFKAYRTQIPGDSEPTDDSTIAQKIGLKITLVPNERPNPKLTTSADLTFIEFLLDPNRS